MSTASHGIDLIKPGRGLRRTVILLPLLAAVWFFINNNVGPLWNLRLAYVAMYVIALAGMVVLVGVSGQVSLGHGALMAVGGYVYALWFGAGRDPIVGMLVAALAGIVFGGLVGWVAARLSGPYLAGLTLGLAFGLPELANRFSGVLGGESGLILDVYPPESFGLDFPIERWQAWIAGATAIVVLLLVSNFMRSATGRAIRATRDHESAAALAGINPGLAKVLAFTVSAATAGLAGAVYVQLVIASPRAFAITLSLSLLAGVILGGRDRLAGAIFGAAILALVPELISIVVERGGLDETLQPNLEGLVFGALLLLSVALSPKGMAGLLHRGKH